ncbi:MAG: methyltransferase domain-containing protein [Planctomycetes bacterium]|nr:methyltransferase domain-containing protein [Planctomycetota bacterium]
MDSKPLSDDRPGAEGEPGEARYFAGHSPEAFEAERLAVLGQMLNPLTSRRLKQLPIERGWRCLEIGAGNGSVAQSLLERVGPEGRVVATDINPRFLTGGKLPNLEVRRHDILADDLEAGAYDLAHCRLVLAHLADPVRALGRMASAVRPGGWLFVEEGDFGSFGAADPTHPRSEEYDRRVRALLGALQAGRFIDCYFGRQVPAWMQRLGFVAVGHEGLIRVSWGGEPSARFLQMSNQLARGPLLAAGVLTEADLEGLDQAYQDPSFSFVDMTLFGVWGQRPG